jgi:hypothetical protein
VSRRPAVPPMLWPAPWYSNTAIGLPFLFVIRRSHLFAVDGAMRLIRVPIQQRMSADDLTKAHLGEHVKRVGTARYRLARNVQRGTE